MKKSILQNITQICLIVFSVVLGLYLSERIEDRKNKKEAEKLMSKIKSELSNNIKILDHWVPYHQEVVGKLDSLVHDEKFVSEFVSDKSKLFEVFSRGTLMKEMPTSEAWDIAKSHPLIVDINYDELFVLTRIYNQQKSTFEPIPKLMDFLLSTDFNSPKNAGPNLISFKGRLHEISMRELQLIAYYNEGDEILKFRSN